MGAKMNLAAPEKRVYPSGALVLREGECGEGLYVIESGYVSVIRETSEGPVVLAERQVGDVFGEMSLIDGAPCSATIRAEEELHVLLVKRENMSAALQDTNWIIRAVLETLVEKLRTSTVKVTQLEEQMRRNECHAQSETSVGENEVLPLHSIALKGKTPQARHALYDLPMLIVHEFPFQIGRWSAKPEKGGSWWMANKDVTHLEIHDKSPYMISKKHCRFTRSNNRVYLEDCGSRLGTWLNGHRLGDEGSLTGLFLPPGVHELCLGERVSPFLFEIIVPEA